jgi:hypothetical protein
MLQLFGLLSSGVVGFRLFACYESPVCYEPQSAT